MSIKRTLGGSRAGKSKRAAGRTLKAPELIAAPALKKRAAKTAPKPSRKVKSNAKPVKVRVPQATAEPARAAPRQRNKRAEAAKAAKS
ncbi:MAG: hypothetical protein ACM3L9_01525, partial [Deltaproteobacteria bacterium]